MSIPAKQVLNDRTPFVDLEMQRVSDLSPPSHE